MIAFHMPPCAGSSGIQRTLRFVQHLPDLGWEPVVLSAHPIAYPRTSHDLLPQLPEQTRVERTLALDTARHLAIGGRYFGFLARPDRWRTWRMSAVPRALRLTRTIRFDAIWSTYPIATAHAIAADVQRSTGLPWVADFRDPMAQTGYPVDPKTWQSFAAIEQRTVPVAARSVYTTPSAARLYKDRFAQVSPDRMVVIENGYDEESFVDAERSAGIAPETADTITLLHSGIVYPSERDPRALLRALACLKAERKVTPGRFRVRFRASEHEQLLRELAAEAGVLDLVEIAPPIPYQQALQEMMRVDGLVLLQASNCNEQIPAKLYEYLRARRPILALTDSRGDTARALASSGVLRLAPLDDAAAITQMLVDFIADRSGWLAWRANEDAVQRASRRSRASELARLLDAVAREARSDSSQRPAAPIAYPRQT